MANQRQVGEGAEAAGNGRDEGGHLFDAREIHVAHDSAVYGCDARVEDNRAGLDHLRRNQVGASCADDEDISGARDLCQILRVGVGDSHGRVLAHEHERGGLAADIAAPDHDRVATSRCNACLLQYGQDDIGGGGDEAGEAEQEIARVARAEAVHILLRAQDIGDDALPDVRWQRQKEHDAIRVSIIVEGSHLRLQFLLLELEWVGQGSATQADLAAGAYQLAAIHLRRRVVSHDHLRQIAPGDGAACETARPRPATLRSCS